MAYFEMPEASSRHAKILAIAWPMMLSSMSVPLLGLVDTALLGHLDSERYLGAIAIGSNFIGLMYWSFGFLRMSTTGLTAIDRGKHSLTNSEARQNRSGDEILARSMLLGLLLGLLVSLLIPLVVELILQLMKASEAVAPLAREYIGIRQYSAPAVFVTFAISGWLIGMQKARQALALVLATNLTNIALDVWFIYFLGWQSAGAAWATLIAEWLGLLLGLYFVWSHSSIARRIVKNATDWLNPTEFRTLLGVNYHLLVRTVLLLFVLNFFTAQGSSHGDTVLAANAILLQLILLSAYVIDGFSFAAEALCGEAYGARDSGKLNQVVFDCLGWAAAATLVFLLIYLLLPRPLIGLLTDMPQVLNTALDYRSWLLAITAVGFIAYIMDGLFIGTGQTRAMNHSMSFSVLLVFLPVWWLTRSWGNDGLWLAYLLFIVGRGLSLGGYWLLIRSRSLAVGTR